MYFLYIFFNVQHFFTWNVYDLKLWKALCGWQGDTPSINTQTKKQHSQPGGTEKVKDSFIWSALPWPASCMLQDKLPVVGYNIISETAPWYLSDLVQLYTPSRSSTDTWLFRIPRWNKNISRTACIFFLFLGPVNWNQLPFFVQHSSTADQFKRNLKTSSLLQGM